MVYGNPESHPIYFSDPSFLLYPTASFFYQTGIDSLFLSNLSPAEVDLCKTLTLVPSSEKDRNMGRIIRFTIDGHNANREQYKLTGWKVVENIAGLETNNGMISLVCPDGMVTNPTIIGSGGFLNDVSSIITSNVTSTVTSDISSTISNVPPSLPSFESIQNLLPTI